MTKFWFDHLHLVVPNPEKMADFFEKAFKAEKVSLNKLPDGRIRAEINFTGGRMIINTPQSTYKRSPDSPQKRYGTEHFGMKVDELETALQQCQAAGAKLVRGITQVRPGVRIAFFMAPNNVLVELVEMK
jgi:predicted enzyme related to lactoylglutathione lyase